MSARVEQWPALDHARARSIVLPRRKVLFVPVPKSGCTSVLWLLAQLSGVDPERFEGSTLPEVSPVMNIHDISLWPTWNRWDGLAPEQQQEIQDDDEWFRFAVVRDPARRLWSAWQSKLLLREPTFARRFRRRGWFPRIPGAAEEIVEDFRTFVRALGAGATERPVDVHWAPQTLLLDDGPSVNHVGHHGNLDATLARLNKHMGDDRTRVLRRENASLLPFHPGLLDAECRDIVNAVYDADYTRFAYPRPRPDTEDLEGWLTAAAPLVPAVAQLVNRHERIRELSQRAARRT